MAGGISINILSNVREAVKGADDVAAAVDDVSTALHDLTKEGKSAADRLEGSFRDTAAAADKTSDQLKAKFRSAYQDVRRESQKTGTAGKSDMGKIGDGAKEVQQEFGQNLGETFSSFRGDLSDLSQLGQDTLGGLAGTVAQIGPAGVAAGAGLGIVAGAVGIVSDAFAKAKEATDEAKESAFQYANQVGDAFSAAGYQQRMQEWTSSTDKWKQALDIAKVSGLDIDEVLDALASGGPKLDSLWKTFETGANNTGVATNRVLELEGALKGTKDGYKQGTAAAEANARALARYADQAGKATGKTDDLGNKIVRLPDNTEVVVDVKTGKAYTDLDHFETEKKRATADETVKVSADTRAARESLAALRREASKPIRVSITGEYAIRGNPGRRIL